MNIPCDVQMLLDILEENGNKAYVVGGCVRDAFLGKSGGDIDITTSAKPESVISVLSEKNIRVVETGLKHGTVTAVVCSTPYEITTFRKDGVYKDSRHPESVDFVTDIREDLSRRDFTINAMAYNPQEGVVDLFGGKKDLENRAGYLLCTPPGGVF